MVALWLSWWACESGEREGDEAGECRDGADNDLDGDFDCDDAGCEGSPDCVTRTIPIDTASPTTIPTTPTDTGNGTPATTPQDDPMGVFCGGGAAPDDVTGVAVTLVLDFDVDDIFEGLLLSDCVATYEGTGSSPQAEGGCLTFTGSWTLAEHDCPSGLISDDAQIVWYDVMDGDALHTLRFDPDRDQLSAWVAHDAPRQGAPADAFDDQFWVTEIDDAVGTDDRAEYVETGRLRDGLLEFGTLEQTLEVLLTR